MSQKKKENDTERVVTLGEFLADMQTPISKLTVSQLKAREQVWRTLWGWTDDTVKRFLQRIGTQVRFMRRDYKGTIGELGEVKFEPKQIEIATYEKVYNYEDGKYYYERKLVIYPWAAVAWMEEIFDKTLAEEVEQYAIEAIPETNEVEA